MTLKLNSTMTFYTPLFSKIVDSSLWIEPDFVVKVFLTMLAKKDRDNIVRGNAFNIAQWSKKTEAEVLEALKILAAPDLKRLEPQPFEGRRIEKVEGEGWLILNGKHYQELMVKANARAYKTKWEAEKRKIKVEPTPPASTEPPKPPAAPPPPRFTKPSLDACLLLGAKIGLAASEVHKFFNFYESKGWKVGKTPMQSVSHAMAGWKSRCQEFNGTAQPALVPDHSKGW